LEGVDIDHLLDSNGAAGLPLRGVGLILLGGYLARMEKPLMTLIHERIKLLG